MSTDIEDCELDEDFDPEMWLCHECNRENLAGATCKCGGTLAETIHERAIRDFALLGTGEEDTIEISIDAPAHARCRARESSLQIEILEAKTILGARRDESLAGAARRVMSELLDARARAFGLAISKKECTSNNVFINSAMHINRSEATKLLKLFDEWDGYDDPTEDRPIRVKHLEKGCSGAGLYASDPEVPSEGSVFLGLEAEKGGVS